MNMPAMNGANVVAMRARRILASNGSVAMSKCESVIAVVKSPDLFIPFPNRISTLIPGEFVGVNQMPRRNASDNDPRQKTINGAAT
jgi:hypothetical protein